MRQIASYIVSYIRLIITVASLLVIIAVADDDLIARAQNDCGIVDSISYPIETTTGAFQLTQDYAVPSPRHQGRFHTGEDWYGGRGRTAGQPVRAAAKGRVTYAYSLGWGRDGGVVIVQHTLPDGTIFYTQYGHLGATDSYPLPTRLTCVDQGDVIGVISDARPAPHLHFEVRVINGADPGPGYTVEAPYNLGYRSPTRFITNLQAEFNLAHTWRVDIGQESYADEQGIPPPLELNDNSLLYLDGDGDTLRRALPDGRILWRQRYDTPAVAITGFLGQPLLTFADGTLQFIDAETGAAGDFWQVDAVFSGSPFVIDVPDTLRLLPTGNGIIALEQNWRDIRWQAGNIPPYTRIHATADRIVLLTLDNRILLLDAASGERLNDYTLREAADFATSPQGDLLVYSKGGLWQIHDDGEWALHIEDAPGGGSSGAVLVTEANYYLFDGTRLYVYDADGVPLWDTPVPDVSGRVSLAYHDNTILLVSSGGNIAVASGEIERLCNFMQVYGTDDARQWHALGSDGILRIAIANQIIGLDWARLTQNC